MTGRSIASGFVRVGAVVLFGAAWLLLLLVVLIGAGYSSDDPLLAVYFAALVVVSVIVWRGVARHQTAAHAALGTVLIVATFWLASIYG